MSQIEIAHWDKEINYKTSDHEIKTIDYNDTDYSSFFGNFMLQNVPCVIKNVTSKWNCAKNWVKNDNINFDYIRNMYGNLEAPVADCDTLTFNAHCKTDFQVKEYMNYLQNCNKEKLLYLKDWHLQKLRSDDSFYDVPSIFASDWLNEFAIDQKEDDFMFVYIGPQNSWTPLHADVYNSYSWSVNVVGRKQWILFPPGEEEKLRDILGNLPMMFIKEKHANVKFFEVIQDKGDALFVPSGWYHQVVNLLDTISVNHNWVNGCNISTVWLALEKCMISVEKEIIDLKDTPEYDTQCQLILKSVFGMNFTDFLIFVNHIAKKRLFQLQGMNKVGFSNYELGRNHIKFDLKMLKTVMDIIVSHPIFSHECILYDIRNEFINIRTTISEKLTS